MSKYRLAFQIFVALSGAHLAPPKVSPPPPPAPVMTPAPRHPETMLASNVAPGVGTGRAAEGGLAVATKPRKGASWLPRVGLIDAFLPGITSGRDAHGPAKAESLMRGHVRRQLEKEDFRYSSERVFPVTGPLGVRW
jgi:hypothetical protein